MTGPLQLLRRSFKQDTSPLLPALRTQVNHPVAAADELLVMFPHNYRISRICQPVQKHQKMIDILGAGSSTP